MKVVVSPGHSVLIGSDQKLPGSILNIPNEAEAKNLIKSGFVHEPGKLHKKTEVPALGVEESGSLTTTTKNTAKTPWSTNPAELSETSLEDLNIMILERDPTIAPFETREEAVAQLTMDFKD